MAQVKINAMEKVTIAAIDSANPFNSPIPPPRRLDGKPIETKPHDPREPEPPPMKKSEPVPEPLAHILADTPEINEEDLKQTEPEFQNPIIESRSPDGLPSYRCEFSGRDIMIGLPWYKTSNPVTTLCLMAMCLDFGRDKLRGDASIGSAMIYHSRNIVAHKFLQTDAKWLLMLDDDIIPCIGRPGFMRSWIPKTMKMQDLPLQRHVLHRLIGSGKTLIGGAYFGRQEGAPLMCSDHTLEPKARVYQDEVAPVDWVGTGCMLVHRKVFADIRKSHPELENDAEKTFNYFQPIDGATGENVSFCRRAKKAGHQPHIDLGLPVFHLGYSIY